MYKETKKTSTHTCFGLLTGSRVTDFEELSQTKCSNYNQTCCAVIRLVHAISFDAHFFSLMAIPCNNTCQDKPLPHNVLRSCPPLF